MATLTSYSGVSTGQWEVAAVMIEISILPIGGIMAGSAIRAIFAIVLVIFPVTGVTIHGRTFELPVYVAGLASRLRVFALQFERRQIVIEFCG